jgi:2-keto-3-deoxy-galactonokinase
MTGVLASLRHRSRGGGRAPRHRLPGHDANRLPVPVLMAGMATTRFGLHATALVYPASLAVLAAAAVGILVVRPAERTG